MMQFIYSSFIAHLYAAHILLSFSVPRVISKEYLNDPRFQSDMAPSSLFPPGHRQRITKFVKGVTKQLEEERKQQNRKRSSICTCSSKRAKSHVYTSSGSANEFPCDEFDMMGDVQRQKDCVTDLKVVCSTYIAK